MRAATALRAVAVGIAVLGVIDPAVTRTHRPPLDVDLAVPRAGTTLDAAVAAETGADAALVDARRRRLVRELGEAVGDAVRLRTREFGSGERLPCAAELPCVVVTDQMAVPRGGVERERPLFAIAPAVATAAAIATSPVTIEEVVVPPAQVDVSATATVTLAASGVDGRDTQVEVRDGGVLVGTSRHLWTGTSPATVSVPWWPARAGRRTLSVVAATGTRDGAPAQQEALTVDVDVTATPWPVLVVEFRPSWAATFVRRVLEGDPRLAVDAHAVLAPGLATTRGRTGLDEQRIADARVVVVGGLDGLTQRDVALFERFVAERGGALVLVPDSLVPAPAARLLPGRWRPRLDRGPTSADGLRASEWLLASDLAPGDLVLATHAGAPVIVSRPIGEGRVVVVGALDAWRHRATVALASDVAPYAAFWRGLVADLARGTGAAVEVRVDHVPGDAHAIVDVQARVLAPPTAWRASARLVCGTGETALRLWPQARAGQFRGQVPWPASGTDCEIVADLAGIGAGRAAMTMPSETRAQARRAVERLEGIAAVSGGTTTAAGDVPALARALVALDRPAPTSAPSWPLRSWWWGVAASLALGGEWWLRRRAGER